MTTDHNDSDNNLKTPSQDEEILSQRLKEARDYLGLSQEFVADHLGIPRVAVSAIESSKRKVSSIELKKLAKLYRRPYEFFLGQDELPEDDQQQEKEIQAIYRTTRSLSSRDREQVLKFAEFLKHAGSLAEAGQADDNA